MALTRLPKNAFATGSVDTSKIEDGTIQNQELAGSLSEDKIATGTIANAKLSNTSITINGTPVALGASASVGVDVNWQSVITADGSTATTGVAGNGYFIDTTSNAHTFNLPASAALGDQIAIKDYAGTFNTNNLTIGRNGHNIQGVANNSLITTNRASLLLVYVDSTKGWIYAEESNVADLQGPAFITATGGTITTSGDFKIHSFTGDGCFVVSSLANPLGGPNDADYLVVAGGGGGGFYALGGGGAGGFRLGSANPGVSTPLSSSGITLTATTYPITVGGGGGGSGPAPTGGVDANSGNQGSNSVFSTITSTGGGGGGNSPTPGPSDRSRGGSGGAIGRDSFLGGRTTAANGNTPPTSPPQGNPGGVHNYPANVNGSRGGGGAGGSGTNGGPTESGGASAPVTAIFGAAPQPFYTGSPANGSFAGGGGGATFQGNSANGGGSTGGTANAITDSPTTNAGGGVGQVNTGGGGGSEGPGTRPAGAGGSGIVLIRYKFQ